MSDGKGSYLVKAEVVSPHNEDPMGWNRVQVYIPAYHGSKDQNRIGKDNTGGNVSKYPWAQSNISVFKVDQESDNRSFWQKLFGGNASESYVKEPLYPEVGDIVWITFEGGDLRKPICMGIVASTVQDSTTLSSGCQNLAELVAEVLSMNEGSYTSVNWDDNGATSVGKAQWNANRCRNILIRIRDVDKNGFDSILNKYGASDFIKSLNEDVNWNTFLIGQTSPRGRATVEILGTDASHTAQDAQIIEDCQKYIDNAKKYGITDTAAIIYYCDVENQWGAGGAEDLGKNGGNSLESMHKYAMSHKYGQYASRRNNTYNKIKQMEQEGKLTPTGLVDLSGANLGGQLLWPCPEKPSAPITSKFGLRGAIAGTTHTSSNYHKGVDIGVSVGTKVISVADGTIMYAYNDGWHGGAGKCVAVQHSNNMVTKYFHQSNVVAKTGQQVKAGTVIGYSGNTGNSSGPHLHFQLEINGSPTDPLPYIKG